MKNDNSTSKAPVVNLLTDTSPSICDPMLRKTAERDSTVLEILNGAIKTLNNKSGDCNI